MSKLKRIITNILITSICLVFISCSMSSDKEIKNDTLDLPVAEVQETMVGFNMFYYYSMFFPLKALKNNRSTGLTIQFEPKKIELNKEISFFNKSDDISLDYYPLKGSNFGNGSPQQIKMLTYSTKHNLGNGKIIFEILDPKIGGRIKGKILEGVMYGFFTKMEDAPAQGKLNNAIEEPKDEMILKVKNLEFDTTFKPSMF